MTRLEREWRLRVGARNDEVRKRVEIAGRSPQ